MNNIYYKNEQCLKHTDSHEKINSFLWKLMYKRVQKKMNKDLINPINIKKIIFNKKSSIGCTIRAQIPNVMFRNQAIKYQREDLNEYYLPLSIGFENRDLGYHIVLIDGEIDLRVVRKKSNQMYSNENHSPMLLVKNLKVLEECFSILLESIENEQEKNK